MSTLGSQFIDIATQARSKESIIHNISMKVKLSIDPNRVMEVVRGQGYADRFHPRTIGSDDIRKQHSLDATLKSIAEAYVHKSDFMDLIRADVVLKELQGSIQAACGRAMLLADDFTCEVMHVNPDDDLRAHIAAAGFTAVAEYFKNRDAEPEIARANVKIVAADQDERVKAHQDTLAEKDKTRQQAAQDRNKALKERAADFEFAYKKKKIIENDRNLALEEQKNAALKDEEESAIRERKRLDMQLELEREEGQAKIRAQEKSGLVTHLEALLSKLSTMPVPDYSQVRTLVTGQNSSGDNPRDLASGLVWALLTKALDGETPEDGKKRKGAEA